MNRHVRILATIMLLLAPACLSEDVDGSRFPSGGDADEVGGDLVALDLTPSEDGVSEDGGPGDAPSPDVEPDVEPDAPSDADVPRNDAADGHPSDYAIPDSEEDAHGDADATHDPTPDQDADAPGFDLWTPDIVADVDPDRPGDLPGVEGACLNEHDLSLRGGADGTVRDALAIAVPWCSINVCLACLGDVGACGCEDPDSPDCTFAFCVTNCITTYRNGDADEPEVDAALRAARNAGISDPCMGCYGDITGCIVLRGCAFGAGCASNPDSEDCIACQCEEGCVDDFASCSGLPPYVECIL